MDLAPAGSASIGQRLADLVLTRDFQQRRRVAMVLTTAVLYLACLALFAYGVVFELFPASRIRLSAILIGVTAVLFFALVRSGLNLRFAEPSLAFPQAIVAQTLLSITYSSLGPVHGGVLVFLTMVMLFGMFDMGMRKVRILMFYTICAMGAAMAWSAYSDPLHYPPAIELFYFAMMCTALPAISSLSVQLSKMRDRLKTQKTELENLQNYYATLDPHYANIVKQLPNLKTALDDLRSAQSCAPQIDTALRRTTSAIQSSEIPQYGNIRALVSIPDEDDENRLAPECCEDFHRLCSFTRRTDDHFSAQPQSKPDRCPPAGSSSRENSSDDHGLRSGCEELRSLRHRIQGNLFGAPVKARVCQVATR